MNEPRPRHVPTRPSLYAADAGAAPEHRPARPSLYAADAGAAPEHRPARPSLYAADAGIAFSQARAARQASGGGRGGLLSRLLGRRRR